MPPPSPRQGFHCSLGCPTNHFLDQTGLEFGDPPASASAFQGLSHHYPAKKSFIWHWAFYKAEHKSQLLPWQGSREQKLSGLSSSGRKTCLAGSNCRCSPSKIYAQSRTTGSSKRAAAALPLWVSTVLTGVGCFLALLRHCLVSLCSLGK